MRKITVGNKRKKEKNHSRKSTFFCALYLNLKQARGKSEREKK